MDVGGNSKMEWGQSIVLYHAFNPWNLCSSLNKESAKLHPVQLWADLWEMSHQRGIIINKVCKQESTVANLDRNNLTKVLRWKLTPALSHDQDLKKGTNKRLMYFWPPCHTNTGNYCQNLKRLRKKWFLVLFSFGKSIFSSLKHPFCLVSLWYYHSCVPGEILNYFDP